MSLPTSTAAPTGVVYLVHFTEPYRHARHYTGWTADLESRLAEHQAGRGARQEALGHGRRPARSSGALQAPDGSHRPRRLHHGR